MLSQKTSAIPSTPPPRPRPSMGGRTQGSAFARTASDGLCVESRGLTNDKKDGRGKASPQSTNKQVDIFAKDVLRPGSTSDFELLATGKPLSLKEFSKGKSVRDLPCLVKVVAGGHRSLCDLYSFGQEQMFVVLEKKSMRVVTCKGQVDGSSYVVPLHTSFFHLVPYWMDAEGIRPSSFGRITANELLQSKALPLVFAVVGEFEVNEHHSKKTVPVGTLLFPKEKKQLKGQRQWVLHAKSNCGMVQITPDCKGRFSILACDVRLSLQQALDHLKPPFTMRTVSDCDTLYVNVVTVENVHKEDVFIGMMKTTDGTSLDDIAAFSRIVEMPVSFNLTVVTMVPKKKEVLDQIYDFAHSKYHKVMCNPVQAQPVKAAADSVLLASNPAYVDVSMASDHMKEELRAHPGSSTKAALHAFTAREHPSSPLQSLAFADPYLREEHIYDAIGNYATLPIVHQKATLMSESAETSLGSEPSHSSSIDTVSTTGSIKKGCSVEESNIAYLKMMERDDILHLLDAMNLSAYKEAFEQEQIDGETMACLSADMLIELGVSKSLHRLRLMKIISGRISASTFITIPRLCSSS